MKVTIKFLKEKLKELNQKEKDVINEFPEIKPLYWNKGKKSYDSLGNPWGEDWYYFYKITRKCESKYLDIAPYYVHSRWGHRWKDDPDYVVDPGKSPNWNPKNQ